MFGNTSSFDFAMNAIASIVSFLRGPMPWNCASVLLPVLLPDHPFVRPSIRLSVRLPISPTMVRYCLKLTHDLLGQQLNKPFEKLSCVKARNQISRIIELLARQTLKHDGTGADSTGRIRDVKLHELHRIHLYPMSSDDELALRRAVQ